jgi:hypothetical protein
MTVILSRREESPREAQPRSSVSVPAANESPRAAHEWLRREAFTSVQDDEGWCVEKSAPESIYY